MQRCGAAFAVQVFLLAAKLQGVVVRCNWDGVAARASAGTCKKFMFLPSRVNPNSQASSIVRGPGDKGSVTPEAAVMARAPIGSRLSTSIGMRRADQPPDNLKR
jgi:hypothetical protein